jgi:peptidase MA superfamily protein
LKRWLRATLASAFAMVVPAFAGPLVVVQAPASLAGEAAQVRGFPATTLQPVLHLVGLEGPGEAGPPITVVLAAEDSPEARSAPPWVTGYAHGESSIVVLLPARVPRYPDRSLAALYRHEIAHVLIDRAAAGADVPRWFHEGVAMAAGREWGPEDRTRLAFAVLVKGEVPLERLDRAFAGGENEVTAAYALAEDLVQDLLSRHRGDQPVTAAILRAMREGRPFEAAFAAATGDTLADVEASYWRRRTFWNRWLPIVASSAALWIGITVLALVAFQRRHARDVRIRQLWDEEERILSEMKVLQEEDEVEDGPVN